MVGGSIKRAVLDLFMESARTLDSRRRLRVHFPNLDAVPWTFLPEPALTAGLELSPGRPAGDPAVRRV